ncbi:hypothetical protein IAQ61_010725 [Plenodomus lingam]|uniref:uncharacterized protein n=1 Tax=Leptosphaeria maculans TaxID=5022 RepID=UPI00331F16B8|nr:hypothetical protein IAQ61_010725 [Plenodomus lingam]
MRVPTASTPAGLFLQTALEWANMRSQGEDQTPCIRPQGWYHGAERTDAIHGSGGVNTPHRATRCERQIIYCATMLANELTLETCWQVETGSRVCSSLPATSVDG